MDTLSLVVLWVLFGIAAAIVASNKGRSGCGWFIAGSLLGPFGLIFALVVSKIETLTSAPVVSPSGAQRIVEGVAERKCPFCAEWVKAEAIVCRYCQRDLPTVEPEKIEPPSQGPDIDAPAEGSGKFFVIFGLLVVLLVVFAVTRTGTFVGKDTNTLPYDDVIARNNGWNWAKQEKLKDKSRCAELENADSRYGCEAYVAAYNKPGSAWATDYASAVKESDDYGKYKAAFDRAAKELIDSGRCTAAELKEQGGFWKSTSHGNKPVYFTYCGGQHVSKRVYLDVSSGKIFK